MDTDIEKIDEIRRLAESEFELLANFSLLHKYLTADQAAGRFWSDSEEDAQGQPIFVPNDIRIVISHKAKDHQAAAALLTKLVQLRVMDMLPVLIRSIYDGFAKQATALVERRQEAESLLAERYKPRAPAAYHQGQGKPTTFLVPDLQGTDDGPDLSRMTAPSGGGVSNSGLITPTADEVRAFKATDSLTAVGDAPMDYSP